MAMPNKPIDLPPAVARAFVRDMKLFYCQGPGATLCLSTSISAAPPLALAPPELRLRLAPLSQGLVAEYGHDVTSGAVGISEQPAKRQSRWAHPCRRRLPIVQRRPWRRRRRLETLARSDRRAGPMRGREAAAACAKQLVAACLFIERAGLAFGCSFANRRCYMLVTRPITPSYRRRSSSTDGVARQRSDPRRYVEN